ncbi:MAG: bifunctional hydroxymethylpyrimidine kinase/phosphomethylpyrimidine kinase [Thermotogae bacterium]|nr:bifunctional hydroxymethylpyrimidine kinase/phosphomethylpyrimidine kinase [Thermotogota bacterium]
MERTPKALSIAGYDPSGGAGILADLRTFWRYGVYGVGVITAITFQNTQKVLGFSPLSPEDIENQLLPLIQDMEFEAVKVGMLVEREIILKVAQLVESYALRKVIVDPVLKSSSGADLLEEAAYDTLKERLFPLATLVTPNIPEAELLTSIRIGNVSDMERAAEELLKTGVKAVLIKGGHLEGDPVDVLKVRRNDGVRTYRFWSKKYEADVHGTGCVLSSSVVALLSLGYDLITAVSVAVSDMAENFKKAIVKVGKGRSVIFTGSIDQEKPSIVPPPSKTSPL